MVQFQEGRYLERPWQGSGCYCLCLAIPVVFPQALIAAGSGPVGAGNMTSSLLTNVAGSHRYAPVNSTEDDNGAKTVF